MCFEFILLRDFLLSLLVQHNCDVRSLRAVHTDVLDEREEQENRGDYRNRILREFLGVRLRFHGKRVRSNRCQLQRTVSLMLLHGNLILNHHATPRVEVV